MPATLQALGDGLGGGGVAWASPLGAQGVHAPPADQLPDLGSLTALAFGARGRRGAQAFLDAASPPGPAAPAALAPAARRPPALRTAGEAFLEATAPRRLPRPPLQGSGFSGILPPETPETPVRAPPGPVAAALEQAAAAEAWADGSLSPLLSRRPVPKSSTGEGLAAFWGTNLGVGVILAVVMVVAGGGGVVAAAKLDEKARLRKIEEKKAKRKARREARGDARGDGDLIQAVGGSDDEEED